MLSSNSRLVLMKYASMLLLVASFAVQAEEASDPRLIVSVEPTELDTVTVYGKAEPLPCLGCDRKPQKPPLPLRFAKGLGIWALSQVMQQPRVRGEPNDEAAYHALRAAHGIDDSSGGIDRHPNSNLYNWVPTYTEDDVILNPANAVLARK